MATVRKKSILFALSLIAVSVAIGVIAAVLYSYWQGDDAYNKIAATAFEKPLSENNQSVDSDGGGTSSALDLAAIQVDWDALRAINPDVVGWVYMPDTAINYPIVHSHDNDEYLYVNFNGQYANGLQATYGTPFLLAQNAADFSDAVNIVQAHNMSNGSMFSNIPNVLMDPDSFNSHRSVYILSPTRNYRLTSISMLVCDAYDEVVRTSFSSREEFTQYVANVISQSVVDIDSSGPSAADVGKLFLLSTCTSDNSNRRCILACAVTEYVDVAGSSDALSPGDALTSNNDSATIEDAASALVS